MLAGTSRVIGEGDRTDRLRTHGCIRIEAHDLALTLALKGLREYMDA